MCLLRAEGKTGGEVCAQLFDSDDLATSVLTGIRTQLSRFHCSTMVTGKRLGQGYRSFMLLFVVAVVVVVIVSNSGHDSDWCSYRK